MIKAIICLFLFIINLLSLNIISANSTDNDNTNASIINTALHSPYIYESVNVITGEYCENSTDLKIGIGSSNNNNNTSNTPLNTSSNLSIKRYYFSGDPKGQYWYFNHPNLANFSSTTPQNPKFHYETDENSRLKSINFKTPETNQVHNAIRFNYSESDLLQCEVESFDGQTIQYSFEVVPTTRNPHPYLLKTVTSQDGKSVFYDYKPHPTQRRQLLTSRATNDGHYLINEYYDSFMNDVGGVNVKISDINRDFRIGRVKLQKGPVGHDSTPVITARYFYYDGYTEVFDALNRKTVYYYGKQGALTAILKYGDNNTLYRGEYFTWNDRGQLLIKAITDGNHQIHEYETFNYDSQGNLIKNTLYGNLSGECKSTIQRDSKGAIINNGIESYSKHYRYSDDDKKQLLLQFSDDGTSTRYQYTNDTLTGKLTYFQQKLKIRQFYTYDSSGNLIETITDDGTTEDPNNINGITERKITRITLNDTIPAIGMPKFIDEYIVENGIEHLEKHTELTYDDHGKISSQKIFNSNGDIIHNEEIKARNETGTESQSDIENNTETSKELTYDLAHRIVSEKYETPDGKKIHNTYQYDIIGNKIASIDIFGNKTTYKYDAMNRLIQTSYPKILRADGLIINPGLTKTYDISNNVTSTVDGYGYTTRTRYNNYGKPIEIIHPDLGRETFTYYIDGKLKKWVAKSGVTTTYSYGFNGKIVDEMIYDSEGTLIGGVHREYTPFRLISETDIFGRCTTHTYDSSGRTIQTVRSTADGDQITRFTYDQKGRIEKRIESFSDYPEEQIIGHIQRDENGLINSVSVLNESNSLIKHSLISAESQPGTNTNNTQYFYDHINSIGQNVLQTLVVNPSGEQVFTTYDALERPSMIEKRNIFGQTTSQKTIFYDNNGNKAKEIHQIIGGVEGAGATGVQNETSSEPYIVEWFYGYNNQLEIVKEGGNKTTLYGYNSQGFLTTIQKPDGITLSYIYNPAGKISNLKSNKSIDYTYTYDERQRLVSVYDALSSKEVKRGYNDQDQMIHEELSNGFSIDRTFDLAGRKRSLHLPDGSLIVYDYHGTLLSSVTKYHPDGSLVYQHKNLQHNLRGKIQEAQLIGRAGTLTTEYDDQERITAISSEYWNQQVQYDEEGHLIESTIRDPSGVLTSEYGYGNLHQINNESGQASHESTFNSLYNCVQRDGVTWSYNGWLQLTEANGTIFRYDANGNLTEKVANGNLTTYQYDALNRLIKVINQGNNGTDGIDDNKKNTDINNAHSISKNVTEYTYDAFNRRDSKIGTTTEYMLYDGSIDIGTAVSLGESDSAGSITKKITQLRVLGTGLVADVGAAIAIEIEDRVYAPIHDHRGSITCLIDAETAQPVEWIRYSAFGERELFNPNETGTGNPWQFSSKRYDEETGFVYFGHRYYSPEVGRWITQDPMGTPESINRYAYTQNNPITKVDPTGLFSFSSFWDSIINAFASFFGVAAHSVQNMQTQLSFFDYYRSEIETLGETFFGSTAMYLAGVYNDKSETGVHGKGELNDKVRITLINGILNARIDYKQTIDFLSESHGGCNIHYLFDATQGWTWDILRAVMTKMGYTSPQAYELAQNWKDLIEEMGGVGEGGIIIHYAHSIGCAHTNAALKLLTPEEREMIRVYTFGAPSAVGSEGLNGATNYMSVRDGVCLFDPLAYFGGIFDLNSDVVMVGSWFGIPFVDHTINGGSYLEVMQQLGEEFIREFLR